VHAAAKCESFCYTEALWLLTKRARLRWIYSNEQLSLGVPVNSYVSFVCLFIVILLLIHAFDFDNLFTFLQEAVPDSPFIRRIDDYIIQTWYLVVQDAR
jgi:hypothetical protein